MVNRTDNKFTKTVAILWEGIVVYIKNIDTFLKFMAFPVFGQLFGLVLILTVNYFYVTNISSLIKIFPYMNNITFALTVLLIGVFPGFLIFCKAFYDFLLAYGALNSIVYVSKGKKPDKSDPATHVGVLKKRIPSFLLLWAILAILTVIGAFPLFILPALFIAVYFSLCFQTFMLEDSNGAFSSIKRSITLVKTNYLMTLSVTIFSFLLTYVAVPSLVVIGFEKLNLIKYLSIPVQKYAELLPVEQMVETFFAFCSDTLKNFVDINLAKEINLTPLIHSFVKTVVSSCVTMFLLPMRCAWFTLLYKDYDTRKTVTKS